MTRMHVGFATTDLLWKCIAEPTTLHPEPTGLHHNNNAPLTIHSLLLSNEKFYGFYNCVKLIKQHILPLSDILLQNDQEYASDIFMISV